MAQGKLSVVATPIGNLEDITLRALRTLKACNVIYAEDTRVISKLLARYEIKKPLQRLDAATEVKKADDILARLEAGEHIALVTDAGTPGISDPGARLVAQVRKRLSGATIEAIPGPSALTTALSIAGVDTTGFTFMGFLPHKKGRQTALGKIAAMVRSDSPQGGIPVVLYESPHRILKLLRELNALEISRVIVARELTKIHEEVIAGTPDEMLAHFSARPDTVRGEFVVIIEAR
ncbi:TPA: 16S rRNA (cytidine(1402)-2'-O)-methyltransferase [Candidatus Kaiserbacteria bacterium]|nr:16S rRNA (cytidine(1402)-2'-O)-methyltransferase [Candidatus Kaiserbacteria bacterium]